MAKKELDQFYKSIYDNYVKKSLEENNKCLEYDSFKLVLKHTSDILIHMHEHKQAKNPYICIELDKRMQLYGEINGEKLVFNIWTKEEADMLMNKKRENGRH